MASKLKHPTSSLTLNEDLEVSSSEDERELSIDEDDLLRDDVDDHGYSRSGTDLPNGPSSIFHKATNSSKQYTEVRACSSSKTNAYASTSGEKVGKVSQVTSNGSESELEDGEISYEQMSAADPLSSKTTNHRNEIDDMDLDEICRRRHILPAPRAPRHQHHRFHHDRPITGARGKFYNVDPRQNLSLDEIIRMIPPARRDLQPIHRRQYHTSEANPRSYTQPEKHDNDKLQRGVESIVENYPKRGDVLLDAISNQQGEQQGSSTHLHEWVPDAWHCVSILINNGYSIYWNLMQLQKCENLTEDEETRMYRCVVSYNHVQGICEAGRDLQAKHGAAADFMKKLSKEFPLLGKLTTTIDETMLLDPSILNLLITKLKEKNGGQCKFRFEKLSQKLGNRCLHKYALLIESKKYEACSFMSPKAAKLLATKAALEDLLKEPCPVQKVHTGMEECTTNPALYRGVDSQMVHCYDFSRVVIIDPETARTSKTNKRGNSFAFPRSGKSIQVSFVDPQNNSSGNHE